MEFGLGQAQRGAASGFFGYSFADSGSIAALFSSRLLTGYGGELGYGILDAFLSVESEGCLRRVLTVASVLVGYLPSGPM